MLVLKVGRLLCVCEYYGCTSLACCLSCIPFVCHELLFSVVRSVLICFHCSVLFYLCLSGSCLSVCLSVCLSLSVSLCLCLSVPFCCAFPIIARDNVTGAITPSPRRGRSTWPYVRPNWKLLHLTCRRTDEQ